VGLAAASEEDVVKPRSASNPVGKDYGTGKKATANARGSLLVARGRESHCIVGWSSICRLLLKVRQECDLYCRCCSSGLPQSL